MTARRRTGRPPGRPARMRSDPPDLRIRPRLYRDGIVALGPGKAALLHAIVRTGSLREAAGDLGMSYTRAWSLVRTMNACFAAPLVATSRGGATRGAARLTPRGRRVLAAYDALVAAAAAAAAPVARTLRRELRA